MSATAKTLALIDGLPSFLVDKEGLNVMKEYFDGEPATVEMIKQMIPAGKRLTGKKGTSKERTYDEFIKIFSTKEFRKRINHHAATFKDMKADFACNSLEIFLLNYSLKNLNLKICENKSVISQLPEKYVWFGLI